MVNHIKDSYIEAYYSLKAKWCEAAGITGLFLIAASVLGFNSHWIFPPMMVLALEAFKMGATRYCLQIAKNNDEQLTDLLYAFSSMRNFFLFLFFASICYVILIIGFILLIIPGLYLTLLFSMASYVAADQPQCSFLQVWEEASRVLTGNCCRYLWLKVQLWALAGGVSVLTLGLGSLWVIPYCCNVQATFYLKLREERRGYVEPAFQDT